jgi:hypothetical protein
MQKQMCGKQKSKFIATGQFLGYLESNPEQLGKES